MPQKANLPKIPRIGIHLGLDRSLSQLKWFGRGPHENYWDRKSSAYISQHQSEVKHQYVPYISPQENGNKCDVRWLKLLDPKRSKFLNINGAEVFNFSILPFSPQDLTQLTNGTMRTVDLPNNDSNTLCIDHLQMGVGGDDSWGANIHDEFTVPCRKYEFEFNFSSR